MTTESIQRLHLEEITENPMERGDSPLVARDLGLLGNLTVRMSACVGHANVTVDELFSLKSGDILPLDNELDQPMVFYLNDKPVARGMLVAVGDNFGIQITEILT